MQFFIYWKEKDLAARGRVNVTYVCVREEKYMYMRVLLVETAEPIQSSQVKTWQAPVSLVQTHDVMRLKQT